MEENKKKLTDFIQEDRFDLNSYLAYLFNQFYDCVSKPMKDQIIK